MKNNSYKKNYRTTTHGNAQPYGQWTETVSTAKAENRRCRRANKVLCRVDF